MDHICGQYFEHYLRERPHQGEGMENDLLIKPKTNPKPQDVLSVSEVRCSQRLGGLLKSYSWKAA